MCVCVVAIETGGLLTRVTQIYLSRMRNVTERDDGALFC